MRVRRVAQGALVAAAYAALTIAFPALSYNVFQFRIAEVLKPLVIWNPHLIPAFVIGNFLSNLTSPHAGVWELAFMPFVNLVGSSVAYLLGRRSAYLGAAAYAVITAAGVALMLTVLGVTPFPYPATFGALLVPEAVLIVGGVPIMRTVHRATMAERTFARR